MNFLIDNQLPISLRNFIKRKGFSCAHVIDLGMDASNDMDIFRFALENKMIIISKDEDFFHLSIQHKEHPQLVWVRIGNCRTNHLLSAFEEIWDELITALGNNENILEVR